MSRDLRIFLECFAAAILIVMVSYCIIVVGHRLVVKAELEQVEK